MKASGFLVLQLTRYCFICLHKAPRLYTASADLVNEKFSGAVAELGFCKAKRGALFYCILSTMLHLSGLFTFVM